MRRYPCDWSIIALKMSEYLAAKVQSKPLTFFSLLNRLSNYGFKHAFTISTILNWYFEESESCAMKIMVVRHRVFLEAKEICITRSYELH